METVAWVVGRTSENSCSIKQALSLRVETTDLGVLRTEFATRRVCQLMAGHRLNRREHPLMQTPFEIVTDASWEPEQME